MSLVVLDNFRDLVFSQGPGNMNFLNSDNDLSGLPAWGDAIGPGQIIDAFEEV